MVYFFKNKCPVSHFWLTKTKAKSSMGNTVMVYLPVTNYYLVGKLSTSLNPSSYLVSNWSKSLSISGGDNSCSWVLVRALGLIVKEEFKSVTLGRGWGCGELLVSSSTFAVIQRIRKSVPPQKHPHWKNTSTQLQYSLYCYSWDWWWQVKVESTVNVRSSHSKCSRNPSSLARAPLQLLPYLELIVHTLGA